MSFELIHTSVPRDLDGQSGFGIAAMTRDLPRPLRDALVAWSDGSELEGSTDRAISYAVCQVGGAAWPVLTCVTRCGADWSGRPNRVAHHLVLEPGDRCIDGPIALARTFRFAEDPPEVGLRSAPSLDRAPSLDGAPSRDGAPSLPRGKRGDGATGTIDPAWFEVIADRVSGPHASRVVVRLPSGLDPLSLVAAVTALVEPRRRWAVQWSTGSVVHAAHGLPTIVVTREQDPGALDLGQPAPKPRRDDATPMPGSIGVQPLPNPREPVAQATKATEPNSPVATSVPVSNHPRHTGHSTLERTASWSVKPWVPIVLFAVAGVIMIVALGLLLW